MGISSIISGASSILGAKSQEKAAQRASDAQTQLGRENLTLQKNLAEQQRKDFEPWRTAGSNALNQLVAGINNGTFQGTEFNFDPKNVNVLADPSYQFRLSQGVEALDKSASARGLLLSGAQQKAVNQYAQDYGSQEWNNAYNRDLNLALTKYNSSQNNIDRNYNILNNLSTLGQNAAARQAGATSQLANSSSNILGNIGNAQAQGYINKGNAQANMYSGLAQTANQGIQNYLTAALYGI